MIPGLAKTFTKIRWKIRFVSFMNWIIELYLYLSVIYIVAYFFRLDIDFRYLMFPLVLAIILSIVKPISDIDIAIILDKDLTLEERVITTLEFEDIENPLVANLIIDTIEKLKNLSLKDVYHFRLRKRLLYAIAIPVLVFLSLFIYSSIQNSRNLSLSEGMAASEKGKEIISLAQQLKSERPEIAKRLEDLGKNIKEQKSIQKENIATLDKITREIDREANPSTGNARNVNVELKKLLELATSKLAIENNSSKKNQEMSKQENGSNQNSKDENNRGIGKDSSQKDNNSNHSQDNSSSMMDRGNTSNLMEGGDRGTPEDKNNSALSKSEGTEKNMGIKEQGEASGKETNTTQEGGSLPGKGERENKLGEETPRKVDEGTPQFVPGIPKEEGDIRLEIKGLGKNVPSSIPKVGGGNVKKSSEDPLTREPIPPEYRETIRLYFERLKGER